MEATLGGKAHQFYGPVMPDLKAVGKRTMEWDLNDWNWDGDMFTAAPLNSVPSDCRSRQLFPVGSEIPSSAGLSNSWSSSSDENNGGNEKGKRELEKRRRDVVVVEDEELNDEAGCLNLKLGGQLYPISETDMVDWDGKSGKKSKVIASTTNRAVCQVDDCRADLTAAKDYHRRHKVCDIHSKAGRALVGNVMQRFCQQCSRFHVLQEFDEGKRSCRRRLAGHNRRRRKTHPENVVNASSLNDERGSSYLLVSLLRILSNLQTNSSDQTKDQDLLSHLLRNLASLAGSSNRINIAGLLPGSEDLQTAGTSLGTPEKVSDLISNPSKCNRSMLGSASKVDDSIDIQDSLQPNEECVPASALKGTPKRAFAETMQGGLLQTTSTIPCPTRESIPAEASVPENGVGQMKLNDIDLNNVYDDSHDSGENLETYRVPANLGLGSLNCALLRHQDFQKSSPPRTSGNSGSTSTLSPSSSSGEAQSRTDRIVFKLFGKDPSDFPLVLRTQILDWLSHSPTDIESYIRPGCIILTIYLRLGKCTWEELCCDLSSSLTRLIDASNDSFWRTGWVYTRVQHRVAFLYSGQVVLDTLLPRESHKNCRILSIKPVAVPFSERAQFLVKGFNLSRSTTRLFCALEGKYLLQGSCDDMMEGGDMLVDHDKIQCLSFSCSVPNVNGRGFIEVEDHGFSGSFLPFIVSEKDVCSEICTLESAIELPETADDIHVESDITNDRNTALDFIHEMGWLLHRSQLKLRLDHMDPNKDLFTFKRFKWLMEFSIEHDWCAVVKKLLDIVFDGTVDAGDHPSIQLALIEMGLLHKAVRRHCKSMVEILLRYIPDGVISKPASAHKQHVKMESNFLLRPDASGPGGLTPLHIAASCEGSESVLDALTDDPGSVGIEAWKGARDSTGLTPQDYASLRGYYSYISLVQRKAKKKSGNDGHLVLDIPSGALSECNNTKQKTTLGHKWSNFAHFHTEKNEVKPVPRNCRLCQQKLAYGGVRSSVALYRPVMLSMMTVAAVCVCVALLFKSSPEVGYCSEPFRWELLKYGAS
ncbi:squamosa promoter-binding-like protein 1 isoform X1 [Rhododendron vialii]|uniref:squamosa promoter-binding-like protein 1 isoform X1 n=1 Tax=Rhododendron vialii TaxID=182163 RepID=UPI00265FC67C|nr:squamosa promoter-binding-like protein 1 isoform X1 [Rhododendron vialii]